MKRMRQILIICWLFVCCNLCIACTSATEPEDPPPDPDPTASPDTMWIGDAVIDIGDTAGIIIYTANAQPVGGYTMRLEYDSLVLGVPLGDTAFSPRQLRGGFEQFYANLNTNGEITILATPFSYFRPMPVGQGNTIRLYFYVKEGVAVGTKTVIEFVDAAYDSNAYNWFVDSLATSQYRPLMIPGTITVGDPQATSKPIFQDSTSDSK